MLDIIKIKNVCASVDSTKRAEGQLTYWEKNFGNRMSDMGL